MGRVVGGLDDISHLEVAYHFDRVPVERIETGALHPRSNTDWPLVGIFAQRGNTDWPLVGVFAQRGKSRPNRIGIPRCRLLRTDGLDIRVEGLDAVHGTPVSTSKPYLAELGPQGRKDQPSWATEIMRNHY
ncbi:MULTISPECIES: TrmO family methyltransferase [unclassified Streptomyces]|uniref:TrmO family methyltransferase domain-containing protein n=1 Tax=unclassified Streptomyces TaxID=2593676 RepID=UPI0024748E93|nr:MULTISPECIES: TrmO family methyltransferase [unclassified Streptomyces]MDH6450285.1 tRNA (Thr-GGU) A37 N-methylase [Streptomyces sp. SAI-119]MDH6499172.1 tRNA (Thr-GGU) A37 N-methylase [Streptomyces sp. SAI-149]